MADTTIRVSADTSAAQVALRQLVSSLSGAETAAKNLEKSFSAGSVGVDKLNTSMKNAGTTGNSLISVFSGLTAALGIGQIIRAADTFTQFQNTIKSVSRSQEELQIAMEGVQDIANQTGTPLKDVGTLYAKLTIAGQQLGISQDRVLQATRGVSQQLKFLGLGAAEAQSVMYQFGQAVGLGYARMEEMKQIMEASPAFMKNMAAQFGKTTTQFLADVAAYKVGSEDLINAQARMANNAMWKEYQQTVGDAITKLSNNWQIFLGRLESSTGIFSKLANAIDWLGQNIDILVSIGATFFTMFAVKKILDIGTAFATLNGIMKANPWTLLAGLLISAGAGLAAYLGLSKQATEVINKEKEAQDNLNQSVLDYVGIQLDIKALETAAETYGKQQKLLESIAGFSKYRQEQEKAVADFAKSQNLEYELIVSKAPTIAKMIRDQVAARQNAELRAQIEQDIVTLGKELNIINARGLIQQEQLKAIEKIRQQTGIEISGNLKSRLEDAIKEKIITTEKAKLEKDYNLLKSEQLISSSNIIKKDYQHIEALLKQNEIAQQLGLTFGDLENKDVQRIYALVRQNEELKKQTEQYKEIGKNLTAYNTPQTGLASAATASGQMSNLDPTQAAMTANQTLMNGLQELRNRDLISEQQYQTAKVNAAAQAQQAIYDATKKQYENANLLRIQSQTGTTFGFETQKQMAAEAAAFEMKTTTEKTSFALDQASQMFSALGAQNKRAFEAAKAFNIANAIMNTYLAATKALATYPPPFNFIAMGAAIAMGMAQVATIRQQQYSGRALGGPVMGGQSYIVGENGPELFTPNTTGSITRNSDIGGAQPVVVNFNINAVDADGIDNLLINRRSTIQQIISDAMLEKGQRM